MTTDRHACGLSSFLPMSCRGRAEAFARRLQSRLQSLGRQPSDDPHDTEESWLTTSQQAFPTSRQPRLSSSSESDIYFDFDCDFGSPESPQEEATDADVIHLNRRRECGCIAEHQDLESGVATASATATAPSPGSSESSDNNYYDPEAPQVDDLDLSALIDSTLEVSCAQALCNGLEPACLDCGVGVGVGVETRRDELPQPSEAETNDASSGWDEAGVSRPSCRRSRRPRVDYTKCNGLRHSAPPMPTETHEAHTNTHDTETERNGEVETEGQEEGGVVVRPEEVEDEKHDWNSEVCESETETCESETDTAESQIMVSETDIIYVVPEKLGNEDECGAEKLEEEEGESPTLVEASQPEGEEEATTPDSPEGLNVPLYRTTMMVQSVEESCDHTFLSSLNILKRELMIECPAVPDVEITEAAAAAAASPDVSPLVPRRSGGLEVEDDLEEEGDRPQRVRRCSSLKTGKTPPGTPGRKKIVRFADVLGLDLADVRTFLDEVPKVPHSAYEDLRDADLSLGSSSSISAVAASLGCAPSRPPDRLLVALFAQPGGCADFLDRVRDQQVCLENAVVSDPVLGTIAGTVRVRNLDFHKSVHVRYSVDEWRTFSDLQASYVQNSCDGFSDTFRFTLYAHTVAVGQRLEFAVRFQCQGSQYWDSNRGANYAFQCLPPAAQSPFRPPLMSTSPDEQWASFY